MSKKIKYLCDNPNCLNTGGNGEGILPEPWFQVGYKHGGQFYPAGEFCSIECLEAVYKLPAAEAEIALGSYPVPPSAIVPRRVAEAVNPQTDAFWARWHQANPSDRLALVEEIILCNPLAKLVKKKDFLKQASTLLNSCLADMAGYLERLYAPKK
jgi:hypothetical protein